MKLNDPFGRVEQRKQNSYQSLRRSLIESGVSGRASAEVLLKGMLRRALYGALIVLLLTAVLVLLLPQSAAVTLAIAVVILLWLLGTTFNAYGFIRRYIDEELSAGEE